MTLSALAVPAARADSPSPAPGVTLTADQASARARTTGKAVSVDAATTVTDQLTANPNGTFTLNQALTPVRKFKDGGWKPLDATLLKRADGSIGPALTTSDLTLSKGGGGSLAVMKTGGRSLAVTLPDSLAKALPAPALDGPTATYGLMTGVDLKVTADPQGGFSEVLVVKDAVAAANPALKSLAFTTRTTGVDLAADAAGNIVAKDPHGKVVFSAPAPVEGVWDSAVDTAAPTVTEPRTGKLLDAHSGSPARSSAAEPGATAHTAPLKATYANSVITLTPDPALLSGQNTVWPLYIDPTYSAGGGSVQQWTYVNSHFPTTNYLHTSDATGLRVGYNGWESPFFVGRAFAQMSVPPSIYGAAVIDSQFYATETTAPSCNAKNVELWSVGATNQAVISSSTTWNNQPGWNSRLDTRNVANGYDGCPAASVGFNTKSLMQQAADSSWSTVNLGLRASDESDKYAWKKFQPSSMFMSTTYNHTPATPNPLTTSPGTTCASNPPTAVGNGDVTLYAGVSDPDGGVLGVAFTAVNTATGAALKSTTTSTLFATSGTTASMVIDRATLVEKAGGVPTTFSWNVFTSDGSQNSPTSATCRFTFDPTVPGQPQIVPPNPAVYTVGTPATFHIIPNATGPAPSGYLYQLNGAAPVPVSPSMAAAGFPVTPTRGANNLTVTALSAGGNIGDTAIQPINATAPATALENDLTGTGHADLVVVGNQASLPAGLWLAQGTAANSLNALATNIGVRGTAINTNGSPGDWNGLQTVVGHFASGGGFNDVLAYNHQTGAGTLLNGNGDGSVLSPVSGAAADILDKAFTSGSGSKASSVANAGNLYNTLNGDPLGQFPGLLLVLDGSLQVEAASGSAALFTGTSSAIDLSDTNPAGSGSWAGWSVASTLINGLPALFARDDVGGQLYYYSPQNLLDLPMGTPVIPVKVASSGWDATSKPVLQAADIDRNGTVDLWAVSSNGDATAYLFNGATLTPQTSQNLTAPTHTWQFNDADANAALGTAKDSAGAQNMTASGTLPNFGSASAVVGHGGDLYSPDALVNTAVVQTKLTPDSAGTGTIATTGPAVDTTKSFTVDLWAKPTNYGGVVASQDAAHSSSFIIYAENTWRFGMSNNDSDDNSWSYDLVGGSPVTFGVWAHVTVTFNASNSTMYLYIDGQLQGTAAHTARIASTGPTRVSGYKYQAQQTARYNGQIAGLRTYAKALGGAQNQLTRSAAGIWSSADPIAFVPDTSQVNAVLLANGDTVYITLAGGKEYAQWHYANGTWSTRTLIPTSGSDGVDVTDITAITAIASTATSNTPERVQVLSIAGGRLRHQTWNNASGWSKDDIPPTSGTGVTAIAAAGGYTDGSSQLMAVIGGVEYHQARYKDGTWSTFNQLGNSGVTAVAAAGVTDGSTHFVSVVNGSEYHQERYAGGSWSGFNSVGIGRVTAVAAVGDPDGSVQFALLLNDRKAFWQMRTNDGNWTEIDQRAVGVAGVAISGNPGAKPTDSWYNTTNLITTS
ncbi:LamG-like jellyroll fold domain-containing protein [Kitasatospora sp. NPDC049258]|uniref:LamG-like jellyroll fold domain-containing protein n=1 Tax=Kitasatospora sp. NPDC049258 TaxID=3155394 RepID=UPI0034409C5A